MKVKELIGILSTYNQDADITTPISEDITVSYICKDTNGNSLTKETTMLVFIDPCDSCPTCVHEYMDSDTRMCSFYNKPCSLVEECFQFEEFDER